jgi:hypothetical protein
LRHVWIAATNCLTKYLALTVEVGVRLDFGWKPRFITLPIIWSCLRYFAPIAGQIEGGGIANKKIGTPTFWQGGRWRNPNGPLDCDETEERKKTDMTRGPCWSVRVDLFYLRFFH